MQEADEQAEIRGKALHLGFWAFSSPFATAVTYGVHWLAAEHVRSGTALGYALVGVLTAGFALLAARRRAGGRRGCCKPRQ